MLRLIPLLLLAGCVFAPPVDPRDDPEPTPPPPPLADPLQYLGASADTPTFYETTDVEVVGDAVYTCTGVQSLSIHDASNPNALVRVNELSFPNSHNSFPRCSHVIADGTRVIVTSHVDEVQRTPWVVLLDAADPFNPTLLDDFSDGGARFEEPALRGDTLYLAAHEGGIATFDLSGSTIEPLGTTSGFGNVSRLATTEDLVLAGTNGGVLHVLDLELNLLRSVELGPAVQAIEPLGGNRALVALGSEGIATVDLTAGTELSRLGTHGIAVRLDTFDNGDVLVANWSDLRVYDVAGDLPVLRGVDAVYQANPRPRHLAAAASGDLAFSGEWEGVHALRYQAGVGAPELSLSDLLIQVADDGQPHTVVLDVLNEGQWPLALRNIDVSEGWTANAGSIDLEPGESTTLSLDFAGSTGPMNGLLSLTSNDPDEAFTEVPLIVGGAALGVGDEAPALSATGLNTGQNHNLQAQLGKVVVLSYFGVF